MRIQPSEPYHSLAPLYDQLMSHVDYAMWADHVRELWRRHATGPVACAYDAACGTGRLLEALDDADLRLAGSDGSSAMLELARKRLPRRIALERMDLRLMQGQGQWDAVSCLYDSLNYLIHPRELRQALGGLRSQVKPGGLVLFDICTQRNSVTHFRDRTERGHALGMDWERHSWYEKGVRLHHNDFLVEDERSGHRWAESHHQRIYEVEAVATLAREAGLEEVARYADFTLRPGGEDADRVHFVTRRPLVDASAGELS
jgi:predicted TPR repeat methyltransferase